MIRKIIKIAAFYLGILLIAWIAAGFLISRAFRPIFSPSDAEPLEMVFKKAMSDVVVVKRTDGYSPQITPSPGYLVAYENNQEEFKADAKLFDTWTAAIQLGSDVLEHAPTGDWLKSSSQIEYAKPVYRVDAWGHSFCLLRRGNRVLMISGGPEAPGSPICKDIPMTAEELRGMPESKLLESPAGALVLVVGKND